jgi:hypothetical protein
MRDSNATAELLDFVEGFLNTAGRRPVIGYLKPPGFEIEPCNLPRLGLGPSPWISMTSSTRFAA